MTMPGTFSQIYIQTVFAVRNRECLIRSFWEEELYKYITGILLNHKTYFKRLIHLATLSSTLRVYDKYLKDFLCYTTFRA